VREELVEAGVLLVSIGVLLLAHRHSFLIAVSPARLLLASGVVVMTLGLAAGLAGSSGVRRGLILASRLVVIIAVALIIVQALAIAYPLVARAPRHLVYARRMEVEAVKLEMESRELELEIVAWKEPGCKIEVWASEWDRPIVLGEGGNVTLRGQAMLVRLAVGSGVRVSIEADFNLGEAIVEGVSIEELYLRVGVGRLEFSDLELREGAIRVGVGSVEGEASLANVSVRVGIGRTHLRVEAAGRGEASFRVGLGGVELELSGDSSYELQASVGLGTISALGFVKTGGDHGSFTGYSLGRGEAPLKLVVGVSVGMGDVEVRRR